MNERIKKLKEQATSYTWNGNDVTEELDEQKFAELIVRECADICNKIYFDRYPDAEDFERSEEGDAIKQHFGVEEK